MCIKITETTLNVIGLEYVLDERFVWNNQRKIVNYFKRLDQDTSNCKISFTRKLKSLASSLIFFSNHSIRDINPRYQCKRNHLK